MSTCEELGLLMLIHINSRPQPNYHTWTDKVLKREKRHKIDEVNMLADYVAECRQTLAEAEMEHTYQADQLDMVSGILEVRALNRRDAK